MQRIYLDNNVWDFAYANGIDLVQYFPSDRFTLAISKHGRFEIEQIPDNSEKAGLKAYALCALQGQVDEVHTFGFRDPSLPDVQQRVSGFGVGVLTSDEENRERERLRTLFAFDDKRKTRMILKKQEADIELGALSVGNYVITRDIKAGPLKNASENGGNVIFLNKLPKYPGPDVLTEAARIVSNGI